MRILAIIFDLLLIVGGLLALSGLIVARKPDAQAILDKLMPFQALIGVATFALGIIYFLATGPGAAFSSVKATPVPAIARLIGIFVGLVLGSIFGMTQVAMWSGGLAAERKAVALSQKLAPIQALTGLVAVVAGAVGLIYALGIMSLAEKHDLL